MVRRRLTCLPQALLDLGFDAPIDHVRDEIEIASYGVMSTPALVIDGTVVIAGRSPPPTRSETQWPPPRAAAEVHRGRPSWPPRERLLGTFDSGRG